MKVSVNIQSYYWNKESNTLFDYDSLESNHQDSFQINSDGILAKSGRIIKFLSTIQEKETHKKDWTQFLDFKYGNDAVSITEIKNNTDRMYISISHTFQSKKGFRGIRLKEGDSLKFGKIPFNCKEIKIRSTETSENIFNKSKDKSVGDSIKDNKIDNPALDSEMIRETNSNMNLMLSQNKFMKHAKNGLCRICLSEEENDDNPLIAPCKCSGTMKYIHIDCLKNWLKSKISVKSTAHMISYSFKQLMCELCLTPVQMKFKFKGKMHDLINMESPNCTYIILEQDSKEDTNRLFCLIMFKKKEKLIIGRSNDVDVRLADISISRHHSNLYYTSNGIYLEDNNSKFGSLSQLDINMELILLKPVGLQIGKHFLLITATPSLMSRICCSK